MDCLHSRSKVLVGVCKFLASVIGIHVPICKKKRFFEMGFSWNCHQALSKMGFSWKKKKKRHCIIKALFQLS